MRFTLKKAAGNGQDEDIFLLDLEW